MQEPLLWFQVAMAAAPAHDCLAIALQDKGRWDEAIACYRNAIALDPKYAGAHMNLGTALQGKGHVDKAIARCRKAIALDPKNPEVHFNLGFALAYPGRFTESLAALKRGHELGTKEPGWSFPSAEWVRLAEAKVAMAAKLPALLKGEFEPSDNQERLGLAGVCRARNSITSPPASMPPRSPITPSRPMI